ncbi:helix-turn-helix domain-containing protein [Pelosinus sp. UFO1]|uniref:helix-turn-helix domain-containing protein n=1 Tax=Pelosinus sp. UFO1 TaxID=484770 RepID=UPI0004D1F9E9|nr:helix-turn-helix domain-containing protein [Pelosinus sp. UFO1]AIF52047.1 hypothetical protein UFO1_2500 [Pelosinus sp. UFO1]
MDKFSEVVVEQLKDQKISIPDFAKQIGFSATYTYNLLNGNKRWNADSTAMACKVLKLEIEFKRAEGA